MEGNVVTLSVPIANDIDPVMRNWVTTHTAAKSAYFILTLRQSNTLIYRLIIRTSPALFSYYSHSLRNGSTANYINSQENYKTTTQAAYITTYIQMTRWDRFARQQLCMCVGEEREEPRVVMLYLHVGWRERGRKGIETCILSYWDSHTLPNETYSPHHYNYCVLKIVHF